jgi:hypothetical protein
MNLLALAASCLGLASFVAANPSNAVRAVGSEFRLAPKQRHPEPPTLEQLISDAEKSFVRERLWLYQGFVEDPSGTRVRGVKIDVFRSGSGGKTPLATTRSDSRGHFLVHLTNGEYTAVLKAQGFRPLIYIFEITYEGAEKELRLRLALAPST